MKLVNPASAFVMIAVGATLAFIAYGMMSKPTVQEDKP